MSQFNIVDALKGNFVEPKQKPSVDHQNRLEAEISFKEGELEDLLPAEQGGRQKLIDEISSLRAQRAETQFPKLKLGVLASRDENGLPKYALIKPDRNSFIITAKGEVFLSQNGSAVQVLPPLLRACFGDIPVVLRKTRNRIWATFNGLFDQHTRKVIRVNADKFDEVFLLAAAESWENHSLKGDVLPLGLAGGELFALDATIVVPN